MRKKLPSIRKLRALSMRTMPLMITCRELESFIVDYLDDALPRRSRAVFELHIRLCRDCRSFLEAYRRTIDLSQAAMHEPAGAPIEQVPEDLVKAILAARAEEA